MRGGSSKNSQVREKLENIPENCESVKIPQPLKAILQLVKKTNHGFSQPTSSPSPSFYPQ